MSRIVEIYYTNWRGESRWRKIVPTGEVVFEANEWHAEEQWLIVAQDNEDGYTKKFAMKDIKTWRVV